MAMWPARHAMPSYAVMHQSCSDIAAFSADVQRSDIHILTNVVISEHGGGCACLRANPASHVVLAGLHIHLPSDMMQ